VHCSFAYLFATITHRHRYENKLNHPTVSYCHSLPFLEAGNCWEDVNVYNFGAQYDHSDHWSFRVGYSHGDQPFESAQALFNILAPATIQDHLTAGLTYRFGQGQEINLAYMHAFDNEIEGQNVPNTGTQTGNVRMSQNEVEIGWAYRF
jgi:long-chain fatty acid transport protein